jgi:predicted nucleic acid-binding protein
MIILDSDVISEAMRSDSAVLTWLDRQPRTSVWTTAISVLEIRFGIVIMPSRRRRTQQETAFARLLEHLLEGRVLPFDQTAAEEAALLMEVRQRTGRPREIRDTMIAGIAVAQRATLATRNVRHFDDLSVPVIDPWRA